MSIADFLVLCLTFGFLVGIYAIMDTSSKCSREEERAERERWKRVKQESEAREHEQKTQDDGQP